MPIIEVNSVSQQFRRRKRSQGFWGNLSGLVNPEYETKTAVDHISFGINAGEIVGYISPNGAGKSTTIKMLSGILAPSSGSIHVLGLVLYQQRKAYASQIGVVFGQRTHLWRDVPVIDCLNLLRDIYKIPEAQFRRKLDRFLIRPISPFLQLLGEEVSINGVADVIFGLAATWLAMVNLKLQLGWAQWVYLLAAFVSSAAVELGITLIFSSAAFWTGRSSALVYTVNQVNWNMVQQYPLDMFGRGFRVFVTCGIPVAFLNYYPARWLLGKVTPADPWYFLSFLSPFAALVLLSIASLIWQKGLRQYSSTGS